MKKIYNAERKLRNQSELADLLYNYLRNENKSKKRTSITQNEITTLYNAEQDYKFNQTYNITAFKGKRTEENSNAAMSTQDQLDSKISSTFSPEDRAMPRYDKTATLEAAISSTSDNGNLRIQDGNTNPRDNYYKENAQRLSNLSVPLIHYEKNTSRREYKRNNIDLKSHPLYKEFAGIINKIRAKLTNHSNKDKKITQLDIKKTETFGGAKYEITNDSHLSIEPSTFYNNVFDKKRNAEYQVDSEWTGDSEILIASRKSFLTPTTIKSYNHLLLSHSKDIQQIMKKKIDARGKSKSKLKLITFGKKLSTKTAGNNNYVENHELSIFRSKIKNILRNIGDKAFIPLHKKPSAYETNKVIASRSFTPTFDDSSLLAGFVLGSAIIFLLVVASFLIYILIKKKKHSASNSSCNWINSYYEVPKKGSAAVDIPTPNHGAAGQLIPQSNLQLLENENELDLILVDTDNPSKPIPRKEDSQDLKKLIMPPSDLKHMISNATKHVDERLYFHDSEDSFKEISTENAFSGKTTKSARKISYVPSDYRVIFHKNFV